MSAPSKKSATVTVAPITAARDRSSFSSVDMEKEVDHRIDSARGSRNLSVTIHGDKGDKRDNQDGTTLAPVVTEGYARGFRLASIVIAICLAMFLVALDMTIVSTAIPRITDQFKSLQDVGWYGSAFFLTIAASQGAWGKAYKYFDLKWVFLTSIAIFELGSLICGIAPNSVVLILGRAIAGWGGAGISAGCYSIIAFSVPAKQVPAFTGILGAVYAVASVAGPLLGGVFTDDATWRWCFLINLPIGAISVGIIVFVFTTPHHAKPVKTTLREKIFQLDLTGSALILCATVCIILALQWGGTTKAWKSADVIGTIVAFVVILIIFAINETLMGERALFVRRLMKQKTLIIMCAYNCLIAGALFVWLYYLPIYFQSVKGVSAAQSGIRNVPLILTCALFTVVSGATITITGHYVPMMIVGSIFSTVGAALLYTLDIGTPSAHWIGYQIVGGIGIGLALQIPIIVGQSTASPSDLTQITSVILFFQTFVGSIWISLAQALFVNRLLREAAINVPQVPPAYVVATGATNIRIAFSAEQVPGIIKAYMAGLTDAYTLAIPLASIAVIVSVVALVIDYRVINQEGTKDGEEGEAGDMELRPRGASIISLM